METKLKPLVVALALALCSNAHQAIASTEDQLLQPIQIKATASSQLRAELPQTIESTTAQRIMETVNVVDTEDAVKYLPSLFIRKRNYGDTQPVMATRTWGVGSSARSLVYADGVLLTALVANNNTIGAPRWGMVAPEEIERIDVMYGPFSAAYSGNAMGAVMEIITRMPQKFEASVTQTLADQAYSQYAVSKNLLTSQTNALLGNKQADFSYWLSINRQDSHSQPLTWVTATALTTAAATTTASVLPVGTVGGFADAQNKYGQYLGVWGAAGMLHTVMENYKLKAAYDLSPTLSANYTYGYWTNNAHSEVQSFLATTATGAATFGSVAGFASGYYDLEEQHSMHNVAIKSNTQAHFDWEATASLYNMDRDQQKFPGSVLAGGTSFSTAGRVAVLDGTGWNTMDIKGIWRTDGRVHEFSFGGHRNEEQLSNVTYNNTDWTQGAQTGIYTAAKGKTITEALWLQDAWKFAPGLKVILGGRYEQWDAKDGYNYSGNTGLTQAARNASNFSPKAQLSWDADWLVTASMGKATRYPTVSELYQLVAVGATTTNPNPNLLPERVMSEEVAFERGLDGGRLRISLFQEDVKDALISQTNNVIGVATPVTFITNVDQVRNRGVELAYQRNHVLTQQLELQGSVTYVDSCILADTGWSSPKLGGVPVVTSVMGKHAPNVPQWRATLLATGHSSDQLSTTLGMRYSGKQYSTLDNTDNTANVYGAFDAFFVADIRTQYKFDKNWVAALGVDNVLNRKYWLFHPFPQRTVVGTLKYAFN